MTKKLQGLYIILVLHKNLKSLDGWAGKLNMADATKSTACQRGHMTYTQAPAVLEKNNFHLFHVTQPVKNSVTHI